MLNKQNIISGLVITGIVLLVNVYDTNASSLGITKDDILNILLAQEGQVDDFSFSFTMEHTINDNGKVTRTHKEISLFTKGDLFRTKKQTFLCENAEKKLIVDTEISADGQIVYLLDRISMTGEVETKSPKEAGVGQNWGWAYTGPTLRKPRRRGNRGYEGNLIAALEEDYDNIKLLDKSELFEGRNTIVLERPGYCRIYLDPTINFAVVGLESIGEIEFRAVNSEFKEVRKGFWLPMHMEMSQKRNNRAEKKQLQISDLKVNSGLTAKDFKIEFPKGVRIYDKNIGMLLPPNQSGVSDR
ncbi:MAG: LolA-like protein [Planctomycetota bacterium]|jgi:outer membrane lipoprotein-sorting protein